MKKYIFTFKEVDETTGKSKNVEVLINAKHKEEARNIFKKQMKNVPLNYRIKEKK